MSDPRAAALRLAVESFAAVQGLSDVPIPSLVVQCDGPDLVVDVRGRRLSGRLSGNELLAARVLGVLLRVSGETPHLAWLPVLHGVGSINAGRDLGDLFEHGCRLAEALVEAGLAWFADGEEEEAYLCFRRAFKGSPRWPRCVGLLPPDDLSEAGLPAFFTESLAFADCILERVPPGLRDRVARVRTGADEALSGRRLGLPGALRAISGSAGSPDPVDRASAAEKMINILSEINLSRTNLVPVCAQAGRLLWPLLDDQPFVREVAYAAAAVLAERLQSGQHYRESLPWLDRLIEDGLLRREHLALRYEVYAALGEEDRARSDWRRVHALRDVRPQYGMVLENRAVCADPEWGEFRAEADARASAHAAEGRA